MINKEFDFKSGNQLSDRSVFIWRTIQWVVWLAGIGILFCLLFFPTIGILIFWNILIPLAPLLFVLAAGVWRNVCPLATTNLLPRHAGLSKRKKLSAIQLGKLNLVAVLALYIIVPFRHALFNSNGPATAVLILSMAAAGFLLGFIYEWKSVWCSGLCPIHPVEKLYGGNVVMPVPNVHCHACANCVIPCPDSTPNIQPNAAKKNIYHKISGWLITGGLPGFIWGWFHVPDQSQINGLNSIFQVYKMPLLGLFITLMIYCMFSRIIPLKSERKLTSIFAAAGVSCYYWYRIPSLFGFGKFYHDGMLWNLGDSIPGYIIPIITLITTSFFFYWMVIREENNVSWLIRPAYVPSPGKGL